MSDKLKELNEQLTPIYSKLVSACLDYTEGKVDDIYILGTCVANRTYYNNVFFKVKNNFVKKHIVDKVTDIVVTDEKQQLIIKELSVFKELFDLYLEYTGESPTEVKIKYNVATGKFGMKLSYDKRMEKISTFSSMDVFDEWLNNAKEGNDEFEW